MLAGGGVCCAVLGTGTGGCPGVSETLCLAIGLLICIRGVRTNLDMWTGISLSYSYSFAARDLDICLSDHNQNITMVISAIECSRTDEVRDEEKRGGGSAEGAPKVDADQARSEGRGSRSRRNGEERRREGRSPYFGGDEGRSCP